MSLDSGYNKLDSPYQGEPVDVFAVGVLIFHMLAGFCAFFSANYVKNDNYVHLLLGKPNDFWKPQEEKNEGHFPDPFKRLIERMLHPDPQKRLTIARALAHDWLTGAAAATQEEMNSFFGAEGTWEFKKNEEKREHDLKKREQKEESKKKEKQKGAKPKKGRSAALSDDS